MAGVEHDRDHDWQEDRRSLEFTNEDIKAAQNFIKIQKTIAHPDQDEDEGETIDPASLNINQKWVFEAAMAALNTPEDQRFIDVCGGAGSNLFFGFVML